MSGQNTEKQILAMVILLVLAVSSLGAYVWYDNGRRTEARSEILTKDAERAAFTFSRNCRECHGNDGRGSESDSSLVGPALNTPNNTYAFLTDNQGQFEGAAKHVPLHDYVWPQRHTDAAVESGSGRFSGQFQDRQPGHIDYDQCRQCLGKGGRARDS